MATGADLKEGKYDQTPKSSKEIKAIITRFLENGTNKTSTYKYAMFKSIMDCICLTTKRTYRISFDLLFSRFAEIYWVLVFKHKIPQKVPSIRTNETLAEKVISTITEKYKISRKTQFADLPYSVRSELVRQMKIKCSRYVFGSLYVDTERILYSFSKEKEYIKLNPQIVDFLIKHGNAIQKQNYQAWGDYYNRIGVKNEKDSEYFQRLLKREFGDNTVLPVKQQTTKRVGAQKTIVGKRNEAIIAKRVRDMLAQYPDLGLYLVQICEKLNLDREKTKLILENSYWCRKEGSRYYYVDISNSDFFEDTLFQDEIMDDDEGADIAVHETKSISDSESIMLLNDPEKLIKKLKRQKGIVRQPNSE